MKQETSLNGSSIETFKITILMNDIDIYKEIRECTFKNEKYSVRDNGAVMRYPIENKRVRKLDNIWTFGKKDDKTGYMFLAGVRVHQIVAEAFLGPTVDSNLIIDHIDTNRCNNRPENLRRITKLENVLNNPITRKRISIVCGSVENFLENPQKYRNIFTEPNTSWMTHVSKEEAAVCLKNLSIWAEEDKTETPNGKGLGEWIYQDKPFESSYQKESESFFNNYNTKEDYTSNQQIKDHYKETYGLKNSLTPNALQVKWNIPCEFPLCPKDIITSPLHDYLKNLIENKTFAKCSYYESLVYKAELSEDGEKLVVITKSSGIKPYALATVTYQDQKFIHESNGNFFQEDSALKYFTLALGKEWTGGDVFDDFC